MQLTISKGRITSLLDVKLGYVASVDCLINVGTNCFSRELISEGSTGGLVIFEDRPNYWDAWGVSSFLELEMKCSNLVQMSRFIIWKLQSSWNSRMFQLLPKDHFVDR